MSAQRPNIVLMVSDDHGREALGCYGNGVIRTPYIDALAGSGVRFTNAFCTTASCAARSPAPAAGRARRRRAAAARATTAKWTSRSADASEGNSEPRQRSRRAMQRHEASIGRLIGLALGWPMA